MCRAFEKQINKDHGMRNIEGGRILKTDLLDWLLDIELKSLGSVWLLVAKGHFGLFKII